MFKIGVFSKMNQVTIKTLHHYEEIGLLPPEYVDTETGYRYYSSRQLSQLHAILSLRQMGLSLEEVGDCLQGDRLEDILRSKKKRLEKEIWASTQKLFRLNNYLNSPEGVSIMDYQMIVKELPEVVVACRRLVIPNYNALFEVVPEMGEEMRALGCICAAPPYCFNRYHDGEYKEENIDVEICEAVVEAKTGTDMVSFKTVPKVPMAACTLHRGPYSTIRDAYAALLTWIEANGYTVSAEARESFIDGVWNKDTDEEWLTEVQIPIVSR